MALKITSELNQYPENQLSTKIVRRVFHKVYSKEELQFENFALTVKCFKAYGQS